MMTALGISIVVATFFWLAVLSHLVVELVREVNLLKASQMFTDRDMSQLRANLAAAEETICELAQTVCEREITELRWRPTKGRDN